MTDARVLRAGTIWRRRLAVGAASSGRRISRELRRLSPAQRFACGFMAAIMLAAVAWPLLPRRYESIAVLVVRPTDRDGQLDDVSWLRQALDENAIQSEIDAIRSPRIAAAVITQHQLAYDPEFDPTSYLGGLLARLGIRAASAQGPGTHLDSELRQRLDAHLLTERNRRSYTLRVGYWSSDPIKAAALTKTLLTSYIADQISRRRQSLLNLSAWMAQRIEILSNREQESDRAMQEFMATSGLLDAGAQISLEHQLGQLSDELSRVRAKLIDAQSRADALAAMQEDGTLDNAPDVLNSTSVQRLKEALAAAMAKPTVWSSETDVIKEQIRAESARIAKGARSAATYLKQQETLLQREIRSIREELTNRRSAEFKLEELRREAASDKSVLDDAMVRYKNQAARTEAIEPNVEILAEPEPASRPAFPNLALFLISMMLGASFLGSALIWNEARAAARRVFGD